MQRMGFCVCLQCEQMTVLRSQQATAQKMREGEKEKEKERRKKRMCRQWVDVGQAADQLVLKALAIR